MLAQHFKHALAFVSERGRSLLGSPRISKPTTNIENLAVDLLSERGEATSMARADTIVRLYTSLSKDQRELFHLFLAVNFVPEAARLKAAAKAYLSTPTPDAVAELALPAEPPRQELIRRMNVAPGATALLVRMREELLAALDNRPQLKPLEQDLRRLLASWFNRGFLTLKRIDWNSPAAVLEKVIAYEAVHEIRGWDDLRRRLAPDRRCFAFFHPALPEDPLIFVEVALCQGLAAKIAPLLSATAPIDDPAQADTAIFYSISNCQQGLRGISFGNFLIKQVVEELREELPGLKCFATLSPVPTFRRWLTQQADTDLSADALDINWASAERVSPAIRTALQRLLASYLVASNAGAGPNDPVARFHLGNGARLERLHWAANLSPRGLSESLGMMVNYVYEPRSIEDNHEQFVAQGHVARSSEIDDFLKRSSRNGNGKHNGRDHHTETPGAA